MFDEFGSKFETAVTSKIDSVLLAIQNSNRGRLGDGVDDEGDGKGSEMVNRGPQGHMWTYRGRFWSVPENFELPKKVMRRRAWELWIRGMDTPDGKRIYPFRYFTSASMPKDAFKKLKVEWQPIMKKMENSPGVNIPARYIDVNQFLIDSTFNVATTHLRENVCSFLFKDKNKRIESWTVGTWSNSTQRSNIIKNGSASDISNLPEANC